jgi:rhodanese-related sulfurtransferase
VAANSICGYDDDFPGVLGSAVCKAFDFNIARTGLGELEAIKQGIEAVSCLAPGADKPHFMPNANPLFLKLIAERGSRKVLGAQAVGPGEADKRINVVATAIAAGMTVDQLAELDLCYAPPYSPAMDNLITAANVMRNILDSKLEAITNAEVKAKFDRGDDFVYLDVRSPGEYENMRIEPSTLIPLGKLRERLGELDPEKETVVACKTSLRAYEASLILKKAGFKDVKVMLGGIVMWPYERRP